MLGLLTIGLALFIAFGLGAFLEQGGKSNPEDYDDD